MEAVVERLPHLDDLQMKILHRQADSSTTAELAEAERALPELDDFGLAMLGVRGADIDPATLQRAPTKEGKPNVSDDYQIATRPDGRPVFMKAVPRSVGSARKVGSLLNVAAAQGAVFASRLADRIGYPMARTELEHFDDRAWLVSDYHAGTDHSPNIGLLYRDAIRNPEMVRARPIFNALLGGRTASSSEGIVDAATGEYLAIDTAIMLGVTDEDVSQDDMRSRLTEINNGETFEFTADMAGLMKELEAALHDDSLNDVFRDIIGPASEGARHAGSVRARAQALVALYHEG
jgi:hypothetical protein